MKRQTEWMKTHICFYAQNYLKTCCKLHTNGHMLVPAIDIWAVTSWPWVFAVNIGDELLPIYIKGLFHKPFLKDPVMNQSVSFMGIWGYIPQCNPLEELDSHESWFISGFNLAVARCCVDSFAIKAAPPPRPRWPKHRGKIGGNSAWGGCFLSEQDGKMLFPAGNYITYPPKV